MTNDPTAAPGSDPSEENPWAMQLVVLRDKHALAREVDVCEAAARAVVGLLDDERAAPGGPWNEAIHAWADGGRIRKLVRRADGKRWDDVQELPGVLVTQAGPEGFGPAGVRAFPPCPEHPLPKTLSKLQMGGTVFPSEHASAHTAAQVLIEVTPLEQITSGKLAAQCAHAAQLLYAALDEPRRAQWRADGFRVEVRWPDRGEWAANPRPVSVVDAGFTELDGPTETARAVWRADLES
ncbi:MAG: peptidyl-tRNA hydrolase [Propionibacteriaceae bacterium]|nr:peptidyl-tRNA hydrolase [Propionibacteriaceae bacterium]